MKKIIIKTVSIFLVFVLLMFALFSCGNIGGQTGGFSDSNHFHEYWWEESYAECVDGIERLKSHGSSFNKTILVSYDGDLFDMKYCLSTDRRNADKEVGIFVDRFDRKIENVVIMCFAFLEDVKIYDLVRSYITNYKAYRIMPGLEYAEKYDFDYSELAVDSLQCNIIVENHLQVYEYRLKADHTLVLRIEPTTNKSEQLSDEVVQAIINSIDVDMYKYMYD